MWSSGLNLVDVDDIAVGVDAELLLLGRGTDGVLVGEDLVEFLELNRGRQVSGKVLLECEQEGGRGGKLTVRPLVSGRYIQMIKDWTASWTVKMTYVFQPMVCMETGQANWLSRPAALTASEEKAMPLARISNERTSTGYRACSGVMPME
jgi:hypothetical protein